MPHLGSDIAATDNSESVRPLVEAHDSIGGLETGLYEASNRWDHRPRTGRYENLRGADSLTINVETVEPRLLLTKKSRRSFKQGDIWAPLGAIAAAARCDRVDSAEDPIADTDPVGSTQIQFDADLDRFSRLHHPVGWQDEHLGGDTSLIEAGAAEYISFNERDRHGVEVCWDVITRPRSDDDEVEGGLSRFHTH